jgi:hypothetical protein
MLAFTRAKWIALTGYAVAVAGSIVYTQLGNIANLRVSDTIFNVAIVGSMAATFGGFVAAGVGSAIWTRRSTTRQPLLLAVLIGAASLLLALLLGVNVHGPSAILMFLVLFSAVNVLSLLVVSNS